jgi:LAS superfamily LD-carboxypeptidase LdcB
VRISPLQWACLLGGSGLVLGAALAAPPRGQRLPAAPAGALLGEGYVNGARRQVELAAISAGKFMRRDAALAFLQMAAAARAAGISLEVTRAFATMAEQSRLYEIYRQGRGNLAARPGYSNHQGGIAVDLATGGTKTAVYRWLALNAGRWGFVRTVPSEPWHWEFRPGVKAPAWQMA